MTPDDPTLARRGPLVTFWGAARSVTGSMHLLEAGNHKVLLDCGLHQGRREEARRRNAHFPFHPKQIDAVLLSHAHIDHCGNLPTSSARASPGRSTAPRRRATCSRVMLADSAKIQEEDAAHLNIAAQLRRAVGRSRSTPAATWTQVSTRSCRCPYGKTSRGHHGRAVQVHRGRAHPRLGHGSRHRRPARTASARSTFTGDLGRRGLPILQADRPRSRRPTCSSARAPTATALHAVRGDGARSCTRRSATPSTAAARC